MADSKPNFQFVTQRNKGDCGIAALAMLSGRSYEEVLIVSSRITPTVLKKGMFSSDVTRIAMEFGVVLERRVKAIDLDDHTGVLGIRFPSKLEHFVFLTNGLIFDPSERDYQVWDAYTYAKKFKIKVIDLLEEVE